MGTINSGKKLNLIGSQFGYLTVIGKKRDIRGKCIRVYWLCKCVCGTEKYVLGDTLKIGRSKSCGCKQVELRLNKMNTHLSSNTSEYNIWAGLKSRCLNTNSQSYASYGGRGIKICDEWIESFINFLNDMGKRPSSKHSIDRIDNNGDYCKSNCRWVESIIQANNTRANRIIEYNNISDTLSNWARKLNISRDVLNTRIYKLGWSIDKAFETPVGKRGGYKKRKPITKKPIRYENGKFKKWEYE